MSVPSSFPPIPSRPALFLDFDGTLVELAERPEMVVPPAGLVSLLQRLLVRTDGALAIVTGRRLSAVDAYLKPLVLRGAGLHGAELRLGDGLHDETPDRLGDLATRLRGHFGVSGPVWVEDKGAAVAVHYREAPERAEEVEQVMRSAVEGMQVDVISGKRVFEARPCGVNKGYAVELLMQCDPFKGRTAVFVGDDTTDEDGIIVTERMGGLGVKVGTGATSAQFRLPDPGAVRCWLEQILDT